MDEKSKRILVIDESGRVFLNGMEVKNVTNVDVEDINPVDETNAIITVKSDVVITARIDVIDIEYRKRR